MLVPSMMNVSVSFTAAVMLNGPGLYVRQVVGPPCVSVLSNVRTLPSTAVTGTSPQLVRRVSR